VKTVTEAEWLACDHPAAMLVYLRGEVSERERAESRCRLHSSAGELFNGPSPFIPAARFTRFVAACADRLRGFPLEDHTRRLIDSLDEIEAGVTPLGAGMACWKFASAVAWVVAKDSIAISCAGATEEDRFEWGFSGGPPDPLFQATQATEGREQARLLREVIGNPFRPVSLDPAWSTPAVVQLAQAAYDNRLLPSGLLDHTGLAVLADALEEAGCDNADLLSHLRGPGPHVRGCWALDLVLGKE
jgi:hypothetical protein